MCIGACSYSRISHFKSTFWIYKYKYIIWVRRRFSVAGARNALHGWCAWCRGPLSSRTSLTFSSRCASIREPTCHRTHRTHLYLPGAISSPIDATLGH